MKYLIIATALFLSFNGFSQKTEKAEVKMEEKAPNKKVEKISKTSSLKLERINRPVDRKTSKSTEPKKEVQPIKD